jgi:ferritin-like metal-binding protein YciE
MTGDKNRRRISDTSSELERISEYQGARAEQNAAQFVAGRTWAGVRSVALESTVQHVPCKPNGEEPMIKEEKFESLYRDELQVLYDAERQIIEALPGMIHAAQSADLKAAFQEHLEQTKEQLGRLERLFTAMHEQPGKRMSDGMRALLSAGRMRMSELPTSPILDAALIAAAQKVEHFEISGYGTVRTMAEMLGHPSSAKLLEQTLDEEKDTDATLTEIGEAVFSGEELEDTELEEEKLAS